MPVIPLPMITTSALVGRFLVERWAVKSGEGCECQNELVDSVLGRLHGDLLRGIVGLSRDIFGSSVGLLCSFLKPDASIS